MQLFANADWSNAARYVCMLIILHYNPDSDFNKNHLRKWKESLREMTKDFLFEKNKEPKLKFLSIGEKSAGIKNQYVACGNRSLYLTVLRPW